MTNEYPNYSIISLFKNSMGQGGVSWMHCDWEIYYRGAWT